MTRRFLCRMFKPLVLFLLFPCSAVWADPIWVVLSPDVRRPGEAVLAQSLEFIPGGKARIVLKNGKERIVDRSEVFSTFPDAPGPETPTDLATASAVVSSIEASLERLPPGQNEIQQVLAAWRIERDQLAKGLQKRNGQWFDPEQERAQEFEEKFRALSSSLAYDKMTVYELETVREKLQEAKNLLRNFSSPSQRARIESIMKPWEEELGHIEAGRRKVNGNWLTRRQQEFFERRRSEEKERVEDYGPANAFTMTAQVIDPQLSIYVAITLAGSLVVFIASLMFNLVGGKKVAWLITPINILAANGLIGLVFIVFSLTRPPSIMPRVQSSSDALARAIFEQTVGRSPSGPLELEDSHVNHWIQSNVTWKNADQGGWIRTGLLVGFSNREISVFQPSNFFGLALTIHTYFPLRRTDQQIEIGPPQSFVGSIPLPAVLAEAIHNRLLQDWNENTSLHHLLETYSITEIGRGNINLKPRAL